MDIPSSEQRIKRGDALMGWLAPILLLMFVAGPLILVGQLLYWLKTAKWLDIPVGLIPASVGLEPDQINWVGLRRIVTNLYDTPMWLGLPLITMGLGMLLVWITEWIDSAPIRSSPFRQGDDD